MTSGSYREALQASRLTGTEDALIERVERVVHLYRTQQYDLHNMDAESLEELGYALDAYQRVRCPACIARHPYANSPLDPCPQHPAGA